MNPSLNPEDLSCAEMVELVNDYIEGVLSPDMCARFEAHLGTCDGCTNYLDQMRKTIQLTGRISEDEIEPQARETFLDLFRHWKNKS